MLTEVHRIVIKTALSPDSNYKWNRGSGLPYICMIVEQIVVNLYHQTIT